MCFLEAVNQQLRLDESYRQSASQVMAMLDYAADSLSDDQRSQLIETFCHLLTRTGKHMVVDSSPTAVDVESRPFIARRRFV